MQLNQYYSVEASGHQMSSVVINTPLLLPGEVNISQLQGEIEFNTLLFDKPYN